VSSRSRMRERDLFSALFNQIKRMLLPRLRGSARQHPFFSNLLVYNSPSEQNTDGEKFFWSLATVKQGDENGE